MRPGENEMVLILFSQQLPRVVWNLRAGTIAARKQKRVNEALERSLAIFTVEGAARVPIEVRIAAAEGLGRGGDPPLRQDNLIEVPGLEGRRLCRYPVTVEE